MDELTTAIMKQVEAITALVESNQRLIMILTEGQDEPEESMLTYLDGSAK